MQRFAVIALVLSAFVFTARTSQAQILTQSGPCPGIMTFEVTGALPEARLAFIHSPAIGSWVIPPGMACTGLATGLAWPVVLGAWVEADATGYASVNASIPPAACSNRYLQVIDALGCTGSNVILIG
ncbi:MAG: hypothetical protein D8M59_04405 [Planctomycetes bacterium]|nr:hypothetical protein [Planctomycetota bacterium]NOG55750.1 hypothetical protein [Planctomycetota bacterium]